MAHKGWRSQTIRSLFGRATMLTAVIAVAGSVLIAAGCSADDYEDDGDQATEINITCEDFEDPARVHVSRSVALDTGKTLTVLLCSNPSTGFEWEMMSISDPEVIEESDHVFIPPQSSGTPAVGAPGQEDWSFRTLESGESTISLSYSQPWAGGEKGAWTLELSVNVE